MLRNIQALRALAAMMVVIGHLQPLFVQVHPALGAVALGRAGVDLFFVISGFVMVYTTDRTEPSPAAFAWRRIGRIVPLYWAVTLGVFALALIRPGMLGASRPDPAWLAKSLAFIPFDKGDGTFNPLLPVGWSLDYEMVFYAIFAACLWLGRRLRYPVCGAVILLLALPGFLGLQFGHAAAQVYTRPIMVEFVAGIAVGAVYSRMPIVKAAPAVAVLSSGLMALLASGFSASEPMRVAIAAVAATGVVLAALALEQAGRRSRLAGVQLLGDASYSIYLTHLFATQAVMLVAARLGAASPALAALAILAALASTVALGVLTHLLFERPASRLLKTFPARPASAPAG